MIKNITDYDIQALVDNELDWEEEKRVREALSYDKNFMDRYKSLKSQKILIQNWWKTKVN